MDRKEQAILLLGPTGSGKTPLGQLLEANGLGAFACLHFDFGAQLRVAASGSAAGYSDEEIEFIRRVLEEGALLEPEHHLLALKILRLFLDDRRAAGENRLLVLNGLPRHTAQAEALAPVIKMRALVVLECSPQSVYERIRRNTGGDRAERHDDGLALVRRKLQIFRERTEPLIQFYSESIIIRIPVDEETAAEQMFDRIAEILPALLE